MKISANIAVAAAVIILACQPSRLMASPMGLGHSADEYAISTESFRDWSCGVIYQSQDRELKNTIDAKFTHTMAYLGYDMVRWVRLFGGIGISDSTVGSVSSDSSMGLGMVGMRFNLIDQEVADPTLMEDRIGLTASMEYTAGKVAYPRKSDQAKMDEVSGSVLVSVVNEVDRVKSYAPESISVFGGPVFSDLNTDYSQLKVKNNIGYTLGLEVLYTPSVAMSIAMVKYEKAGLEAGLHIAF